MIQRPTKLTRTVTPLPYTTLFRSLDPVDHPPHGRDRPGLRRGRRPDRPAGRAPAIGDLPDLRSGRPGHHGPRDQDHGRHAARRSVAQVLQVAQARSEEHTAELQSLMRTSYAVFCLKKKYIM